jgi:C-terminal processing protease CtpA/Prc
MLNHRKRLLTLILLIAVIAIACQTTSELPFSEPDPTSTTVPTPTLLSLNPIQPGDTQANEPVFIFGDVPYTSPFFLNAASEPFVMLEDQAGFIQRDREFQFPLESQMIGPVIIHEDLSLTFGLALPTIPQATFVDLDNNGEEDTGVQVFAVAYWSNTWGDPFLEERDGTGWSNAYASTITDPENDDEIIGGTLVVWSPDDEQAFPTGFGEDNLLFTEDDPTEKIPAGYSLVDLNQQPFRVYKENRPHMVLIEGDIAVNDFTDMSYVEAFDALFDKASREYPFTVEKSINWQALYDSFAPRIADARNGADFYRALRDFTYQIPDGHVSVSFNPDVFYEEQGGSFGLVLTELSDGRVIVTEVVPNTPGDEAGIEVGADILSWDGFPVIEALEKVVPYTGPHSTEHAKRIDQATFLPRVPPGTRVEISFSNPGDPSSQVVMLTAEVEYESLFRSLSSFNEDELALPIQGNVLDESGLGYIRISTFNDDYHLMASLWETNIQSLIDNEIPGLIIDLRSNSGGSSGLALDFAGYFFDEEFVLSKSAYYNDRTNAFEYTDYPARIKPAPLLYEGPIAVLISQECVSACEGFAYALSRDDRSIIIGSFPSAGAFGEVGRGQYELPEGLTMQFPTGRSETPNGELLIEGTGIIPSFTVPVTEQSALSVVDTVLQAAVDILLEVIK